ncbi:potassium transporter TrkA [Tolypothrix campylonemoides VB511288]|nr:potassium transporter TrkA [Tolypothrix campylonemoides VB511288]
MFETQEFVEPNLFSVLIQSNSIHCGIYLNEIQLPEKCTVLGILRENQVISIEDNPTIYAFDYILAMAINPMMTPALKVILKKTHSVYYSLKNCLLEARPFPSKASNSIASSIQTNSTFIHH